MIAAPNTWPLLAAYRKASKGYKSYKGYKDKRYRLEELAYGATLEAELCPPEAGAVRPHLRPRPPYRLFTIREPTAPGERRAPSGIGWCTTL